MFTTSARGSKAFAIEQRIRECKTRTVKINTQKLKIAQSKIIQNSTLNMNLVKVLNMVCLLKKSKKDLFLVNVLKQSSRCIE